MSTCKGCLHIDVCEKRNRYHADVDEFTGRVFTDMDKSCEHFKDRSKFIELPCKVGDMVYYFFNDNLSEYCEVPIAGFHIDRYRIAFEIEILGQKFFIDTEFLDERVFLTKEEAEQALAKRGGK